jgi:signal transduction histidine kinase
VQVKVAVVQWPTEQDRTKFWNLNQVGSKQLLEPIAFAEFGENDLMDTVNVKLLLIEDHSHSAMLLHDLLSNSFDPSFDINVVETLADSLAHLSNNEADVVLLDLSLPDSGGLDSFRILHTKFPPLPIIVLTGLDDQSIAKEAIGLGAQDYLVKGETPYGLLIRSILYSIQRNYAQLQATEALTLARDKAIEASSFKSAFVASISHELRTPLCGVLGMLELLLEGHLNEEQTVLAQTALDAGGSLLAILNDILDLSKIEAGKLSLENVPFNVIYLTQESSRFFANDASKKELRLSTHVDQRIPEFVTGDPGRIRQILFNLIGNAVKFTHSGSIAVNAEVDREETDYIYLRFSITDTGPGISEETQKSLFKPFSQVGCMTTKKEIGTGLGLVISKRLAEMMGGEIGLDSNEGGGSTFWFVIPFAHTHKPVISTKSSAINQSDWAPSNKKILAVEDTPMLRQLLAKQLRCLGYPYKLVASAEEALEVLATSEFDLILMDCNLQGMNGFQATQEVRKREAQSRHHIPIIAMTALTMTGDEERCRAASMNDYLAKPFSLAALREKLEVWLSVQTAASRGKAEWQQ